MDRLRLRLLALCLGAALTSGCAVASIAGATAGAAISIGGAVVGTGIKLTGKVVEKGVDLLTPGSAVPKTP